MTTVGALQGNVVAKGMRVRLVKNVDGGPKWRQFEDVRVPTDLRTFFKCFDNEVLVMYEARKGQPRNEVVCEGGLECAVREAENMPKIAAGHRYQ